MSQKENGRIHGISTLSIKRVVNISIPSAYEKLQMLTLLKVSKST
jgi:hypothetical protein